ncbi:MAG: hypothetical protein HQL22_12845 [Candidatus Omnitrophica bacterium]|nr:hypothetical protein [Candidatus Omnitrophota bacterium]
MAYNIIKGAQALIKYRPAVLLLAGVAVFLFFILSSYEHVWVLPEAFTHQAFALENGRSLTLEEVVRAFNFSVFECDGRASRPLSELFSIIDYKCRSYLWQWIPPHPSLSLTWIFSLFLSPVFLYKFLRNLKIDGNVALAAVALYLMNPAVLSYSVMLFRPGKAMTNFSIIFLLYWGSCLYRPFLQRDKGLVVDPGTGRVMALFACIFCSFFWDETALLVYPAMLVFFPRLFLRVRYLLIYLLLPIVLVPVYLVILPILSKILWHASGNNLLHFIQTSDVLVRPSFLDFLNHYYVNTKLLILDSLGIAPVHRASSWLNLLPIMAGQLALLLILFRVRDIDQRPRLARQFFRRLLFPLAGLFVLTLVHNALMAVLNGIWGLYWYGAYWAVFFVIFGALVLKSLKINRYLLTVAMMIVLFNLGNIFLQTNLVYKRLHYYPYSPQAIKYLFLDVVKRFDPGLEAQFSNKELRNSTLQYWQEEKRLIVHKKELPKELFFVDIEMHPGRYRLPNNFFEKYPLDNYYSWSALDQYRIDRSYLEQSNRVGNHP